MKSGQPLPAELGGRFPRARAMHVHALSPSNASSTSETVYNPSNEGDGQIRPHAISGKVTKILQIDV